MEQLEIAGYFLLKKLFFLDSSAEIRQNFHFFFFFEKYMKKGAFSIFRFEGLEKNKVRRQS